MQSTSPGGGWHERNLLSSSMGLANGQLASPSPAVSANQNIYLAHQGLFAKQQDPSVFRASPIMFGDGSGSDEISQQQRRRRRPLSAASLIPNNNEQPRNEPNSSPLSNQLQSLGIEEQPMTALGDRHWPRWPTSASLEFPSGFGGGGGHQDRSFDAAQNHLNPLVVAAATTEEDDDPVTGSSMVGYELLLDDEPYWPPTRLSNHRPTNHNQQQQHRWSATAAGLMDGEPLLPPIGRQQICQCDQCLGDDHDGGGSGALLAGGCNYGESAATNWRPYPDQQRLFGQRSASAQNHYQLPPLPLATGFRQQQQPQPPMRCFSSMSVHTDQGHPQPWPAFQLAPPMAHKMMMTPSQLQLQPQQQQLQRRQPAFVSSSPPADCCVLDGRRPEAPGLVPSTTTTTTTSSRLHWQQHQQPVAAHSSLPTSPVGPRSRRYYLQAATATAEAGETMQPLARHGAADADGPPLGGRHWQNFSGRQQHQQRHRQHHQSIQLKDWPAGNRSPLQLSDANCSRRERRQAPQARQHPSQALAAARSATIDDSFGSSGGGSHHHHSGRRRRQRGSPLAATERDSTSGQLEGDEEDEEEEEDEWEGDEFSGDECALVPLQAKGKLPLSVAEQVSSFSPTSQPLVGRTLS